MLVFVLLFHITPSLICLFNIPLLIPPTDHYSHFQSRIGIHFFESDLVVDAKAKIQPGLRSLFATYWSEQVTTRPDVSILLARTTIVDPPHLEPSFQRARTRSEPR